MARKTTGRLLAIGGAERREPDGLILRRFVELAGGERARIIVCAVAMEDPEEPLEEYARVFRKIGVAQVKAEPFQSRRAGEDEKLLEALESATGVFFTGGDQLQITSVMAGTTFSRSLTDRLDAGLVIGGTSAGAAAMSGTMIIDGPQGGTVRRADVDLAPGLGYWRDAAIDTHFNQRGRVHRLLTLFGENPQVLGIGIDEDTAVEAIPGRSFRVVGSGAVMVFDGRVSFSNTADVGEEDVLALTDSTVHVLADGYGFDLRTKRPLRPDGKEIPAL